MSELRNIPFGSPVMGEEEKLAVLEVLNGPILVHGPKSKEFEAEFSSYTGAPYSVSVSSCTAAMHLAYFDLGIGPGDEVVVPAQTHTATAHAVEFTGAKPVFVDAESGTGNINIDLLEEVISERTKAIAVVHFLGMPVDMDRINLIAQKHNLFVLEDCALAVGSYYKGVHAGLYGDVGCFSFYPVKHLTTAEGGMLITKKNGIYERITRKRAFGVSRPHGERKTPGVYDVDILGFNYRMNEIQAAIGVEQLKRLKSFLEKRECNYLLLEKELRNIDEIRLFQSSHGDFKSSYYCLSILLNESLSVKRFEIVNKLKINGIGTSVYYPKPVPHMSYYKDKYGYDEDSFPVSAEISNRSISLPVGPHVDQDDARYIAVKVKEIISEMNRRS